MAGVKESSGRATRYYHPLARRLIPPKLEREPRPVRVVYVKRFGRYDVVDAEFLDGRCVGAMRGNVARLLSAAMLSARLLGIAARLTVEVLGDRVVLRIYALRFGECVEEIVEARIDEFGNVSVSSPSFGAPAPDAYCS